MAPLMPVKAFVKSEALLTGRHRRSLQEPAAPGAADGLRGINQLSIQSDSDFRGLPCPVSGSSFRKRLSPDFKNSFLRPARTAR
jgi:hypothetical protein